MDVSNLVSSFENVPVPDNINCDLDTSFSEDLDDCVVDTDYSADISNVEIDSDDNTSNFLQDELLCSKALKTSRKRIGNTATQKRNKQAKARQQVKGCVSIFTGRRVSEKSLTVMGRCVLPNVYLSALK